MVLTSQYRQVLSPFIGFIKRLEAEHPDRDIAIVVPELIMCHWYEELLHDHRNALLRMLLRTHCSDRVVVISTPFHVHD